MKKHWYDYLWIFSSIYLILGLFNILFAWLGLICFLVPLMISVVKGAKPIAIDSAGAGSCSNCLAANLGFHGRKHRQNFCGQNGFDMGFDLFYDHVPVDAL